MKKMKNFVVYVMLLVSSLACGPCCYCEEPEGDTRCVSDIPGSDAPCAPGTCWNLETNSCEVP